MSQRHGPEGLEPTGVDFPVPSTASASIDVFQQIINALPEQIALLDAGWNILAVNQAWIKTASLYSYSELQPGVNYFDFCKARAKEGHSPALIVAAGIQEMQDGKRDSYHFIYHGSDRWEGYSFQLVVARVTIAGHPFVTVTRYDVTELVKSRNFKVASDQKLAEHDADLRRRMAREIHDSTMQSLVALGLSLGQLRRTHGSLLDAAIVDDMEQVLAETQRELRSISFLAHPPSLEEMGLNEAVRALVQGFGRRTGLAVSLEVEGCADVGWRSAQVAIYRMVQEALSNVHRHAHATEIKVGLFCRRAAIHVVVADNGNGLPGEVTRGVGLSAMRDRFRELGGRLLIRKSVPGTVLLGCLPTEPRIRAIGDLAIYN